MADGKDDNPVPSTPYSSSKFSLTDNIAFKKVERRRRAKKDLIHKIESKKKALQCASDETEYRSAGLDLLGAACDCHLDIRYSTLGHSRHIRDTFAANSGRKSSGEMTLFPPSWADVCL